MTFLPYIGGESEVIVDIPSEAAGEAPGEDTAALFKANPYCISM
jgi:hypothetical protein